jgi:hypothetical protein
MFGQLIYTILTCLPVVYLLYYSSLWSGKPLPFPSAYLNWLASLLLSPSLGLFLIGIFGVSAWNGGGYYIEVWGRKFERELEALRKEVAEGVIKDGRSTPGGSLDLSSSTSTNGGLGLGDGISTMTPAGLTPSDEKGSIQIQIPTPEEKDAMSKGPGTGSSQGSNSNSDETMSPLSISALSSLNTSPVFYETIRGPPKGLNLAELNLGEAFDPMVEWGAKGMPKTPREEKELDRDIRLLEIELENLRKEKMMRGAMGLVAWIR